MQYQYIPPDMSVVHVRHQQGKGPGEGGDACEEPGRRPVDEAPRGRCKAEMGSSRGTIHGTAFSVFGRKQGGLRTSSRQMPLNSTL